MTNEEIQWKKNELEDSRREASSTEASTSEFVVARRDGLVSAFEADSNGSQVLEGKRQKQQKTRVIN